MTSLYRTVRPAVVFLLAGIIGAALLFTNAACPPPVIPPECTTDADCNEGFECIDGECVEVVEPACEVDVDCDEGFECVDGECVEVQIEEDPYPGVLDEFFDHEAHYVYAEEGCGVCHHSEPNAAGQACTACHDRDEALGGVDKLKDVMHAPALDNGKQGCRACHDEETDEGEWLCSQCHLRLNDL